jgi:hypothetical protein
VIDTITIGLVGGGAVVGALLGAGAAILGGLLSGAYQHMRDHQTRPQLVIDYTDEPGNNETINRKENGITITETYIRVRVRNVGRRVATRCRVYLTDLLEVHPSNRTTEAGLHDSMVCAWAGYHHEPRDIPRGVRFYCDVIHFKEGDPDWKFPFPLFASQVSLPNYKGTYRFRLVVTSDNCAPHECSVDVTFDGIRSNMRAVSVTE